MDKPRKYSKKRKIVVLEIICAPTMSNKDVKLSIEQAVYKHFFGQDLVIVQAHVNATGTVNR